MKKFRVKRYEVPGWIITAVEILRPRKRLSVSKWAEKHRILPDGNICTCKVRRAVGAVQVDGHGAKFQL